MSFDKLILVVLFVSLTFGVAYAQFGGGPPVSEFAFQGILKHSNGTLVDDTKDITISLYNSTSGGILLWTEEHDDVLVNNGVFTIQAGSIDGFSDGFLYEFNFTVSPFVEITIENSDGTNPETLAPRIELSASPFSVASTRASGDLNLNQLGIINASSVTVGTSTTTVNSGNITMTPAAPTLAGILVDATNMDNPQRHHVSGKYAYVAGTISDSLAIIDISDPTNPTLVGSLIDSTNMNAANDVYVSGNYAYVSGELSDTLAIVDVSDPSTPVIAGSLTDSTNLDGIEGVYVSGKYAYVTGANSNSLAIVDISNPANPVLAGSLIDATNMNFAQVVYVSGKYAYVTGNSSDSLAIVDVSDPTNPTLVGSLIDATNMGSPQGLYVSGKYAYVTGTNSDSLAIVDVSDPSSPTLTGSLIDATNLNNPRSVHVAGNYAYVAAGTSDALAIVDVSDPASPFLVDVLIDSTNMDNVNEVFVSGKYAYVTAATSDSLAVVDISGIDVPSASIGSVQTSMLSVTENAVIAGDLYSMGLSVGPHGILSQGPLAIADDLRTVPGAASIVGVVIDATNLNSAHDVYVSGNYAYVAADVADRLTIIDVSDPTNPTIAGSLLEVTDLETDPACFCFRQIRICYI